MASPHSTYTMAALTAVGGIVGYARKKSTPSLLAGLSFATLYFYAGTQIEKGEMTTGHSTALVTSLFLSGAMGMRAMKINNFKSVPGSLALLGGVSAILEAWQLSKSM